MREINSKFIGTVTGIKTVLLALPGENGTGLRIQLYRIELSCT